jgi:hypothetical protein
LAIRVPLFVETIEGAAHADLQICRKLAAQLCKHGISPLPFANSLSQLISVLHALKARNEWPAVFVINTYWAEEILRDMDALTGDTPIMLFHRVLTPTHKPGESADSLLGLQEASMRPITFQTYGAKNSTLIADSTYPHILKFLEDNDFSHIQMLDARSRRAV